MHKKQGTKYIKRYQGGHWPSAKNNLTINSLINP